MITTAISQKSPAPSSAKTFVGLRRWVAVQCGIAVLALCLAGTSRLSAEATAPSGLEQLEWMVGHWIHDSEGVVATMTVEWADDRQAVQRELEFRLGLAPPVQICQTITWDPVAKKLRSSSRSSDGSTGTGVWQVSARRIINICEVVYPDGSKGRSVNAWEYDEFKQCVFSATSRVRDGKALFDIAPTEFGPQPGGVSREAVLAGR